EREEAAGGPPLALIVLAQREHCACALRIRRRAYVRDAVGERDAAPELVVAVEAIGRDLAALGPLARSAAREDEDDTGAVVAAGRADERAVALDGDGHAERLTRRAAGRDELRLLRPRIADALEDVDRADAAAGRGCADECYIACDRDGSAEVVAGSAIHRDEPRELRVRAAAIAAEDVGRALLLVLECGTDEQRVTVQRERRAEAVAVASL